MRKVPSISGYVSYDHSYNGNLGFVPSNYSILLLKMFSTCNYKIQHSIVALYDLPSLLIKWLPFVHVCKDKNEEFYCICNYIYGRSF